MIAAISFLRLVNDVGFNLSSELWKHFDYAVSSANQVYIISILTVPLTM